MDFKRTLVSFEPQFAFLHKLLLLARYAHTKRPWQRPRLAFISSISVVGKYPLCHDGALIVPEEIMEDKESTKSFGYGHAKLVCENILASVASSAKHEMEVCCIRLGQVSGASTSGFWNTKEHIPALVRISQEMRKWPRLKGVRCQLILGSPQVTWVIRQPHFRPYRGSLLIHVLPSSRTSYSHLIL